MNGLINFFFGALGLSREQQLMIIRTSWFGGISFFVGWCLGAFAFMGMAAPFARSESVAQIAIDLKKDRIEVYEARILNTVVALCKSETAEARQNYNERLNDLIGKYRDLTGHDPRIPQCQQV